MTNSTPKWVLTVNEDIASQLSYARTRSKISQRELAEKTGMTQAAISKIEAGTANPTIATIEKLALALGLELELILRSKR